MGVARLAVALTLAVLTLTTLIAPPAIAEPVAAVGEAGPPDGIEAGSEKPNDGLRIALGAIFALLLVLLSAKMVSRERGAAALSPRVKLALALLLFLAALLRGVVVPHAPIKENDHGPHEIAAYLDGHMYTGYFRLQGEAARVFFWIMSRPLPRPTTVLFINALLGALLVPLAFALIWALTERAGAALFAASAVAFSPWLARVAGSESPYVLFCVLLSLALFSAIRFVQYGRVLDLALATVATVPAMNIRAETLPLLLLLPMTLALVGRRTRRPLPWGATGLFVVAGGAALLPRIVTIWQSLTTQAMAPKGDHFMEALSALTSASSCLLWDPKLLLPLVPASAALGFVALLVTRPRESALLPAWFLIGALIWLPYHNSTTEAFRLQANMLLPLLLLTGVALEGVRRAVAPGRPRQAVTVLFVLVLAAQPLLAFDSLEWRRDPQVAWEQSRHAARRLAEDPPGLPILLAHLDSPAGQGRIITAPPTNLFEAAGLIVAPMPASELLALQALPDDKITLFYRGASCYRFDREPPPEVVERDLCRDVLSRFKATPIAATTVESRPDGRFLVPADTVTMGVYRLSPR